MPVPATLTELGNDGVTDRLGDRRFLNAKRNPKDRIVRDLGMRIQSPLLSRKFERLLSS